MLKLRRTAPSGSPRRSAALTRTFSAPTRGWITSESLMAGTPGGAAILENYFPTARGIRPRGGRLRHATLAGVVRSLMAWRSGTAERIFATDNHGIYNVTSPASPTVQPVPDISGLNGGFF